MTKRISKTQIAMNPQSVVLPEAPASKKAKRLPVKKTTAKVSIPAKAGTNKAALLELLTKNAGKPVDLVEMIRKVYGSPDGKGIEGVIIGATIAAEKAGHKIVKEGRGKTATYTLI